MHGYPPELDRAALARLRTLVQALHGDGRAVPLERLAGLAREARLGAGVTIDFAAADALGQPLVVLRVPAAAGPAECLAGLSRRERQVAALVAEGLSNKRIAGRLAIALATVKDHVHRILVKTGLPNRAAVAAAWKGPGAPPAITSG